MRLFGRNAVVERLRSDPKSIEKIYIEEGAKGMAEVRKKSTSHRISVLSIPASQMLKLAKHKNSQGVVAVVDEFEYELYDDLIENAFKNKRCPVFLDGITDPQNMGAILRSLGCLGRFSLVVPTHDSVSVTETVLRISSGGENFVPIAKVANINKALAKAKKLGFWVAGAVVEGGKPITDDTLPLPIALVIGSEQSGIRPIIQKNLDVKVTIPMAAQTLSFNAAHATTILCYEITKQKAERKKNKK
ncbi:MAG: 23S rRNA (guanosine2251-2'-O)-methyltransferase [Lysobacterales bacterium]|jgi:23S rRNA (guanosine2251-2'-O)-methyltransferase